MRSEYGLANFDEFSTQHGIGQQHPTDFDEGSRGITYSRDESRRGADSSRLRRPRQEPGLEFAEELSYAAKVHELLKDRNASTPDVHAELEVSYEVMVDGLTQDEAREVYEVSRARIDAVSRIDPNEMPEGAVPPTSLARKAAISAVEALFHGRGIVFPHVSPLADGGIELESESSQLYIGLWIHDRENIDVLVQRASTETSRHVRVDQLVDVIWEQLV